MLALVTLDNGRDHTRPNTLGPARCSSSARTSMRLAERAATGEIHAVAVTGKPFILAAGADLSKVAEIPTREIGQQMAQLGHHVLGKQATLGVPSFVFINGLALGGGLEMPLNADYRTIDSSAAGARAARGLPRPHPRLGRRLPAAEPDRHRERPQGHHREPAEEEPHAQGARRPSTSASPTRSSRRSTSSRTRSAWADDVLAAPRRSSARTRRASSSASSSGTSPSHRPQDAREPHRHRPEVALRRARPAEGRQERHEGGGLRAEDEALADLDRRRPVPGQHLRLQPGAEARQAPGRCARQGARQEGHQGRRHRRRLHGQPVRAAVRAPPAGARRHHRPRPGPRRQGRRVHPRRDRHAGRQGPHLRPTRPTGCAPSSPARPTRPTSPTATGSSRPSSRSSASSRTSSPRSSSTSPPRPSSPRTPRRSRSSRSARSSRTRSASSASTSSTRSP